jgi:hypothetical protein
MRQSAGILSARYLEPATIRLFDFPGPEMKHPAEAGFQNTK